MYIQDFIEKRYKEFSLDFRTSMSDETLIKIRNQLKGLHGVIEFRKKSTVTNIDATHSQYNSYHKIYLNIEKYPIRIYKKYMKSSEAINFKDTQHWYIVTLYF